MREWALVFGAYRFGPEGLVKRVNRLTDEATESVVMNATPGFKGNKQALPAKPCAVCGRAMSWRKAWAKNWAELRYCSKACRKNKHVQAG